MKDLIEKAQTTLDLAAKELDPIVQMKSGSYDGITMGKRGRRVNSYIQDAKGQLTRLLTDLGPVAAPKEGAAPKTVPLPAPARPVSPPAFVSQSKVVLNELGGDCPVCQQTKPLLLLVLATQEERNPKVEVVTCLDCLMTHKSAAFHGKPLSSPVQKSEPSLAPAPLSEVQVSPRAVPAPSVTVTIQENAPVPATVLVLPADPLPRQVPVVDPFAPETEVLSEGEILPPS